MTRKPRSISITRLRTAAISLQVPEGSSSGSAFLHRKDSLLCVQDSKTHRFGPIRNRCARGKSLQVTAAGLVEGRLGLCSKISETIENLVGPEPFETMQRLVQRRELLIGDAADLLDRLDVLLIERIDDLADFLALRGQANANRAPIDARTLMIEEAEFD